MSIYPSQFIRFEVVNVWIYVNKLKKDKTPLTKKEVEAVMTKIRDLLKTLELPQAHVGLSGVKK